MSTMKVAAISARFQVPSLTVGHEHLLCTAIEQNDIIVVLLGGRKAQPCARNPFSFKVRESMLLNWYKGLSSEAKYKSKIFLVIELSDSPIDHLAWSKDFDCVLQSALAKAGITDYDVSLYGSRDSFLAQYCGQYSKHVVVDEVLNTSGTAQRRSLACTDPDSMSIEFREGVAYAHQQMYPCIIPTVDIAVIRNDKEGKVYVLMGQKSSYGDKYMFPGGHVDACDYSYEVAAQRELFEETGLKCSSFKYISSHLVDDYRYRGSTHKIMTSLMLAVDWQGQPAADDDLSSLAWVLLDASILEKVCLHHVPLMENLLKCIPKHGILN